MTVVAKTRTRRLTALDALEQAADCLRVIAHPHRLRMVEMLLRDRYTVGELAEACGIPSHMASEHLRLMQRCGFLRNDKEGRRAYYHIVEPHLANIMACIEARFGAGANESAPLFHKTQTERQDMEIATITPAALAELCGSRDVDLIDVRTPVEFREVHAAPARNVPLDRLDPAAIMQARNGTSHQPLYMICRSGRRARQACEKFIKAGYANVVNVEGGTLAWDQCGLPVVRGKKAVSLERQVRIAAGLLICTGALLAWLVHPAWISLSGFVGAGLIFAGVTDTCGMGLLLARMPWNRTAEPTSCGCRTDSCS